MNGQTGGPLLRPVVVDPASQKTAEFLRHPSAALYSAQFSPHGRWVSFGARFKPGDERIFVVPNQNGFAPQDRDEFNCVWAQRLDSATKHPTGAAFPVLHFHGAVRSLAKSGSVSLEIAVARDKLVFHLDEARGNIWMTQLPKD